MKFRDLTLQQIVIVIVGLLLGGGFAFGGIASYSSMVGSTGGDSNAQRFNATLPENNFQESAFDLTNQEQRVLSAQNDVVFVNAFHNSSSGREQLSYLENLTQDFDGRVYASVATPGESSIPILYSVSEYPSVVVVGANRNFRPRAFSDVGQESIKDAVCGAFVSLRQQSAQCF